MIKLDKKYNVLMPIKNQNLKRLGRNLDGGYVVDINIIENCKTLITLGLGNDWSFEKDYLKINSDAKVHIYDHTVSTRPYLKEILKHSRRLITFRSNIKALIDRTKYLLDFLKIIHSNKINFYKEKITSVTNGDNFSNISKIFKRLSVKEKVILKIDIEGGEFEILDEIINYADRIEMLIFEFHNLDKNELIFLELIKKLLKYFNIVHLHGNNHCGRTTGGLPIALEMTMINKKNQINKIEYIKTFPREHLDFANNPYKEDMVFYFE